MPRSRPQQSEADLEWLARRALIAMAGEIAHNAGGHWLLTVDEVADAVGVSISTVRRLKDATTTISAGPPMTGWVTIGTGQRATHRLPADRLAEWLTSLEAVA